MQNIALNAVNVKISNGHQRLVVAPRGTPGFVDHDWDGAKREFYQLAKRKYRDADDRRPKQRQVD